MGNVGTRGSTKKQEEGKSGVQGLQGDLHHQEGGHAPKEAQDRKEERNDQEECKQVGHTKKEAPDQAQDAAQSKAKLVSLVELVVLCNLVGLEVGARNHHQETENQGHEEEDPTRECVDDEKRVDQLDSIINVVVDCRGRSWRRD